MKISTVLCDRMAFTFLTCLDTHLPRKNKKTKKTSESDNNKKKTLPLQERFSPPGFSFFF
jgi:hypothetical protein